MFFLTFFSKESIIINIERNLCFVLQAKDSVKKINSVKANFDFFHYKKSFFAMDLIWRSEEIIKFGDFCHFAPIAPNFLRAKIYPNKV